MWAVYSIIGILFCGAGEIFSKKAVTADKYAPYKLRIITNVFELAVGILIYIFGLGESGMNPFEIMIKEPIVIASTLCSTLNILVFLIGLRYIGLSMQSAIAGMGYALLFVAMIAVNLLTGKLAAVNDMFSPVKLSIIIVLIAATVILPNTEKMPEEEKLRVRFKADKRKMIIGILLSLLGLVFDTADSLVAAVALDGGRIGYFDFMMTGFFFAAFLGLLFYIYLWIKEKKPFNIFGKDTKTVWIYGGFNIINMAAGILALSDDAVRANILWFGYPALPIIGSYIFLKERYTKKQSITIAAMVLSTVAFCIVDYFM